MEVVFRLWSLTCARCKVVRLQQKRYFLQRIFGAQTKAPSAKKIPSLQNIHGVELEDDYAWLRNRDSRDVKKYIEAENRFAKMILSSTQEFQSKLIEEMKNWTNKTENEESVPEQLDEYVYYISTSTHEDSLPIYYRRKIMPDGKHCSPEVILDQNELAERFPYVGITVIKLSPSRKLAAFLFDSTGTERYSCQVMEVIPDESLKIIDVLPNVVNFEWGNDDKTLFYTSADHVKRPCQVWMHKIGRAESMVDQLIFEEKDERFFLDVSATKDRRFITINSNSKATSEVSIVNSQDGSFVHKPVRVRQPGVEYYVEHRGSDFYIITNADKPNYRVVRTSDQDPGKDNWQEFIPPREEVYLDDMDLFENHCVLYERQWTKPQVSVVQLDNPHGYHTVPLPDEACVVEPGSNQMFKSNSVRFSVSSPILPPLSLEYNMELRASVELNSLSKKQLFHTSQFVCVRHNVSSKDGVSVPITVFHRKDVKRDGRNPLLVHVYGAYGINVNMGFAPDRMCLLSRGWVVAFCHVRGGGELGRDWYHQGRLQNKHRCFEDLEACIQALQDMGYSSPELTAGHSVSAGGLVLGAVCNRSPYLLKAAILKVPFLDILTAMLDPSLPLTAQEYEEWGDPRSSESDFLNIRSYCPFQNIKHQNYPSILVTSSMNDDRVPYWLPLRWTAKLRAVLKDRLCGRPPVNKHQGYSSPHQDSTQVSQGSVDSMLLCIMDFDGGHFGSGGLHGTFDEAAQEYAFLFKALGLSMAK